MKLYYDTSVLVAVAVSHHPHHQAAMAAYRLALSGRHTGTVSAHGLIETYSTLTRLPLSPMIRPAEAYRYITESIARECEAIHLSAKEYLAVLGSAAHDGLSGGVVYDLLHVRCAEKASCERIYTFNLGDFIRLAPQLQQNIVRP